jgi:tryptophanyl-tRNA synthetase
MKRIFSGIQPTGRVHIGNYFGAWARALELTKQYECIYCIVDYHAITFPTDPKELQHGKREVAVTLLAIGFDPQKCTLYYQSDVPEHTELAWILSPLANMGMLERMTQFKDKAEGLEGGGPASLFNYPVLQAADILLYKTDNVPVGKDQAQHLELTRELAKRFNNQFGKTFPEPQTLLGDAPKILGLDGKQKMSKSLGNTIDLVDTPEQIQKKLKSAFTDPSRLRRTDPGHPEVCNIFALHHLVNMARVKDIERDCKSAALGCGECKQELGNKIAEFLSPIRERYNEWKAKPKQVDEIFAEGGKRARIIASRTMEEVRERVGLRSPH